MPEPKHADLDTVFELLSRSRCRYAMYYLLENEHTNVEKLSRQITAWEVGTSVQSVAEEKKRTVTASLIHNHLPRLAEQDIIEFDHRSGDLAVADRFESVRDSVERARALDGGPIADSEPVDSVLYSDPLTETSTSPSSSE